MAPPSSVASARPEDHAHGEVLSLVWIQRRYPSQAIPACPVPEVNTCSRAVHVLHLGFYLRLYVTYVDRYSFVSRFR